MEDFWHSMSKELDDDLIPTLFWGNQGYTFSPSCDVRELKEATRYAFTGTVEDDTLVCQPFIFKVDEPDPRDILNDVQEPSIIRRIVSGVYAWGEEETVLEIECDDSRPRYYIWPLCYARKEDLEKCVKEEMPSNPQGCMTVKWS